MEINKTEPRIVRLCERYFPGLMRVVFGGVEPAEAIRLAKSLS